MARTDLLVDPTAMLATTLALVEDGQAHDAARCFLELHRHILAGGALPAQWQGDGTAAERLILLAADEQLQAEMRGSGVKAANLAAGIRQLSGED